MTDNNGLHCENVSIERAGTRVVNGVTLRALPGQVTVVLGANGAGKTSLMEGISGLLPLSAGTISIDGHNLGKSTRVWRARHGLSHVEQGRPVFGTMTVEENLMVAAPRSEIGRAVDVFPELQRLMGRKAGLLSGGEQQMVVLSRAILRRPSVLLLDEMSLGLAPVVVGRMLPVIRSLADEGTAVVLVEQFATLALGIGNAAYVLAKGAVNYAGPCETLLEDPARLNAAYLGAEKHEESQPAERFTAEK